MPTNSLSPRGDDGTAKAEATAESFLVKATESSTARTESQASNLIPEWQMMYSRKPEFVVCEQFTNEHFPEGVTRAPSEGGGANSLNLGLFTDGQYSRTIAEGDWVVRPAGGRPWVVSGYEFARDYVAV